MFLSADTFDPDRFGSYDYIVCGSGSSGSALARRLAEDSSASVLLIEAGGAGPGDRIDDVNKWPLTLGSELDWGFKTVPNAALDGRALPFSMGKALGGGSSINVGTWSRGHQADWDYYAAQTGHAAWSYHSVLGRYVEQIEAWTGPTNKLRGTQGVMHLQPAAPPTAFASAMLDAAVANDIPRFPDANGAMMEAEGGCSYIDEIVEDGHRRSVYDRYISPVADWPNLTVLTDAMVNRIIIDQGRAQGVECWIGGWAHSLRANEEVVLCLGSINTPRVLMHSGIGGSAALKALDIRTVSDLPAVGANLHDHVGFGLVWAARDVGLPPAPRSQIACFWKTDARLDSPNAYMYAHASRVPTISPENLPFSPLPDKTFSLVVGARLEGRGEVRLTGTDMNSPVRIDNGYLSDAADLAVVISAAEKARAIGNEAALGELTTGECLPALGSRAALVPYLRRGLQTFWHQCGTARMGRDARTSVVDGELRVHGVSRLRVADASVLPRVTTGNTMAACVVVGELAAAFVLKSSPV